METMDKSVTLSEYSNVSAKINLYDNKSTVDIGESLYSLIFLIVDSRLYDLLFGLSVDLSVGNKVTLSFSAPVSPD